MVVVLVKRAMQGDTVRLEQQILQCVHSRQAQRPIDAVGQVGIVEDDVQAERFCTQCDSTPDASQANQAKCVTANPGASLKMERK